MIEKKDNPYESIIKKSGITIEFSYRQFNAEQTQLKKDKKELASNIQICEAIIANVEENHPYVKELDESKLNAISLYWANLKRKKELEPALKETVEAIEANEKEMAQIREMFEIPEIEPEPKETNEQNVEQASQ